MNINILGTHYSVIKTDELKEPRLRFCDGFCDKTSKKIVVANKREDATLDNWECYQNKVLRHEIIHAFFMESGLQENFETQGLGVPETLVDWFAIQFPKIQKVFEVLKI